MLDGGPLRLQLRGAHWRAEFQERRDDEWLEHTLLARNDGTPDRYYEPVVPEGAEETDEPKEPSY